MSSIFFKIPCDVKGRTRQYDWPQVDVKSQLMHELGVFHVLFCAAGFVENLAQVLKGSIEVPGKNSVLLFVSTIVHLMITSPEYQDLR